MNNNDTQYSEWWFHQEEVLKNIKQIIENCQKVYVKTEQEKMAEYSFNELTK